MAELVDVDGWVPPIIKIRKKRHLREVLVGDGQQITKSAYNNSHAGSNPALITKNIKTRRNMGRNPKEDKLKAKTYKWSDDQLALLKELSTSLGIPENLFVRNMVDAGISLFQRKEKAYTVVVFNLRDDQKVEIERVAKAVDLSVDEVMRACVDSMFKIGDQ